MYAFFQSNGTLSSLVTNDQTIIQGSVNANTLYAHFDSRSVAQYPVATVTFRRSDGQTSPEMIMPVHTFTYNSVSYTGYKFAFYDFWFLAIAGILEMTIKLYDGSSPIVIAQGKITVSVQKSVLPEDSYITPEQYSQMLQNIAALGIDFYYELDGD